MSDYDNFPTPADLVPEVYTAPPLDAKWEAAVMDEIARLLNRDIRKLKEHRGVRFIPAARRDMGEAAEQWQHYAGHIADLVRARGWSVMHIKSSDDTPVIVIAAANVRRAAP